MRVDEKAYCTIHLVDIRFWIALSNFQTTQEAALVQCHILETNLSKHVLTPKIVILVIISEKK